MRTRYALDFRLMTEQRIAILDASYSIFAADTPAPKNKTPSNGSHSNNSHSNNSGVNNKNSGSGSSSSSNVDLNPHPVDNSVMLQPIPDFKMVVTDIVAGEAGNGVFSIGVGLICGVGAVARVGKALHDRLVIGSAKLSNSRENPASSSLPTVKVLAKA